MKKKGAIFVLMIFLISLIPISIAQDLTDNQKEAEELEKDRLKAAEDLQKENAELMSVSTDTAFVHKAWHDTSETIKKIQ